MTSLALVKKVRKAKSDFGPNCPRYLTGALTVEVLREALAAEGIACSSRDVFIRGLGQEVDLVIPRRTAKPQYDLVYKQDDVVVALEVKNSGSFGEKSIQKTKNDFQKLTNAGITCVYVEFEERKSFKWRATKENLGGCECFTLAWHKYPDELTPTEDWDRLLAFIRGLLASS